MPDHEHIQRNDDPWSWPATTCRATLYPLLKPMDCAAQKDGPCSFWLEPILGNCFLSERDTRLEPTERAKNLEMRLNFLDANYRRCIRRAYTKRGRQCRAIAWWLKLCFGLRVSGRMIVLRHEANLKGCRE